MRRQLHARSLSRLRDTHRSSKTSRCFPRPPARRPAAIPATSARSLSGRATISRPFCASSARPPMRSRPSPLSSARADATTACGKASGCVFCCRRRRRRAPAARPRHRRHQRGRSRGRIVRSRKICCGRCRHHQSGGRGASEDDGDDDGSGVRLYTSIYETALRNHIPRSVVDELIRVYSYDVDFQRKAQAGDSSMCSMPARKKRQASKAATTCSSRRSRSAAR